MALASAPRSSLFDRISFRFEGIGTLHSGPRHLYIRRRVAGRWTDYLEGFRFKGFGFTYTDMLHFFFGMFQRKPLSLKLLAMKKVLELDLEVKEGALPQELGFKECASARGIFTKADQIIPFIDEKDRDKLEELRRMFEDGETSGETDEETYEESEEETE